LQSKRGFLEVPVLGCVQVFFLDENGHCHFVNAVSLTSYDAFLFLNAVIKVNLPIKFITPTTMTKIENWLDLGLKVITRFLGASSNID
jgi:hypothetical protein